MTAVCSSTPRMAPSAGSSLLQRLEPGLPEVAEAGVVGTALGVVIVRDDRYCEVKKAVQEVEPGDPVRCGADLVDLVHRKRPSAGGDRCGAPEHHRAPTVDDVADRTDDRCAMPLVEGVGGATGTGEEPGGATKFSEDLLAVCRAELAASPLNRNDVLPDRFIEVLDGAMREVVSVDLKSVRRVEHHGRSVTRP